MLGRVLGPNGEWGQGQGPRPSRRGPWASEPGSEVDALSPKTLVLQSADPHLQTGARGSQDVQRLQTQCPYQDLGRPRIT